MADDSQPDWAFARASLMEAPDSVRIEAHAVELISQGLSNGRVVAFVGAGASMAYGRLAWRDLVLAAHKQALAKSSEPAKSDPRVKRARDLLVKHEIKAEAETNSALFPVLFQLAEHLNQRADPSDRGVSGGFRKEIMDLIKDDFGHAQHIWREVLTEQCVITDGTLKSAAQLQEKWASDVWGKATEHAQEYGVKKILKLSEDRKENRLDFRTVAYLNKLLTHLIQTHSRDSLATMA